jgi:hypothetical protein
VGKNKMGGMGIVYLRFCGCELFCIFPYHSSMPGDKILLIGIPDKKTGSGSEKII